MLATKSSRAAYFKDYGKRWREANPEKVVARNRCYQEANPEKHGARQKAYVAAHPEKVAETEKAYRAANPEKVAATHKRWRAENPVLCTAMRAKRRAAKLQATPAWAEPELIKQVYAEAAYRGMHVDHIVPLQGKTVCGLHVHYNMQLLTRSQNSAKGNRLQL